MALKTLVLACALQASVFALVPSVPRPTTNAPDAADCNRRDALVGGVAAAFFALPAMAEEATAPPATDAPPPAPVQFPTDWGLTQDYYTDAAKLVAHMRLVRGLVRYSIHVSTFRRRRSTRVLRIWKRSR